LTANRLLGLTRNVIEREADPKGDRVKITMSGKFLPYKRF